MADCLTCHFLALTACGAVSDGDCLDLISLNELLQFLCALQVMKENDIVRQQVALFVENDRLAACSETRVKSQHTFLT